MKYYIKKILREGLLGEEFDGNSLYGYHVTSLKNLDAIKVSGLKVGTRAMQGKGLYAFYDYDHAYRYAGKGEINDPIIIKFYVTSPHRFLYLNMDIAKAVLGPNNYHLVNQIENYFYGGFGEFFDEIKRVNPNMTEDKLRGILQNIEDNNTEGKQRTFLFNLIPFDLSDKLNIVWDGNYGLEFRINRVDYVKIVSYDIPNFYGGKTETHGVSFIDTIPSDSKYDVLRDFLSTNPSLDSFDKVYNVVNNSLLSARNNKDYEYYQMLYDLLG